MERFERQIGLMTSHQFDKLQKAHVLVVGVGGVGGYVCEMLVRCGVGKLTIVDFDKVTKSNINRQIIALESTRGKYKVDVLKDRLLDINPRLELCVKNMKLRPDNIPSVVDNKYDYVVDAIDMLYSRIELICYCKENNINVISSMGAGNRIDIPQYVVCDLYETRDDGLAKRLRKRLRKRNVNTHDVVYCKTVPHCQNFVGSIAYHPSVCGITLASFVVNQLIKGEK